MTIRTVMAARIGPVSHRSGPRTVLVYTPASAGDEQQAQIDTVLKKFLRDGDALLYEARDHTAEDAPTNPVISFAERYGLLADPMGADDLEPELVVVIIDPLEDNFHTLTSPARVMAKYQHADLVITELPDLAG